MPLVYASDCGLLAGHRGRSSGRRATHGWSLAKGKAVLESSQQGLSGKYRVWGSTSKPCFEGKGFLAVITYALTWCPHTISLHECAAPSGGEGAPSQPSRRRVRPQRGVPLGWVVEVMAVEAALTSGRMARAHKEVPAAQIYEGSTRASRHGGQAPASIPAAGHATSTY